MVRSSKNARPRNAPTPILFAASPTTLTKVLELSASAAARVEEGTLEILKLIPGRQMLQAREALRFVDKPGSYDTTFPFAERYVKKTVAGDKRKAEEPLTNPKGRKRIFSPVHNISAQKFSPKLNTSELITYDFGNILPAEMNNANYRQKYIFIRTSSKYVEKVRRSLKKVQTVLSRFEYQLLLASIS
jgi:hypothetical protein